jgi:hypothetical protein
LEIGVDIGKKFSDYVDTPMEQVAQIELNTALKCSDFFMDRIKACLGDGVAAKESDIRFEMIRIWSPMHGYVAGIDNTLLDYIHDHPIGLKSRIADRIISTSQRELTALRQRLNLKGIRENPDLHSAKITSMDTLDDSFITCCSFLEQPITGHPRGSRPSIIASA